MNVEIVKVPNNRPSARPKRHGNSPRLYLELVENKDRVRQELINQEYVPPDEPEVSMSDIEDEIPDGENLIVDEETSVDISESLSDTSQHDVDPSANETLEHTKLDERISEMFKVDDIPQTVTGTETNRTPNPPALAEVVRDKKYYRDISQVTKSDIDEEDEKRQLLFKFDLLRRQYKDSQALIPEYTIMSDLATMQKSYETILQRVVLDSSVEDYKNYFRQACFGVEWALNYFGFDISGFTADQMSKMNTYERLLVELCAKHYNPAGSSVPVEIRLLGMIILNAALFIGMKMMVKKFDTPAAPKQDAPIRKMKGPQNIDDIRE